MPYRPKDATPATAAANREAAGLIAGFPDRKLLRADGSLMFDLSRLDFNIVTP